MPRPFQPMDVEFDPFLAAAPPRVRFFYDVGLLVGSHYDTMVRELGERGGEVEAPNTEADRAIVYFDVGVNRASLALAGSDTVALTTISDDRVPQTTEIPSNATSVGVMLFEDGSQFVRMEDFDWAERIGAQIDTLLPGSQHNILINNLYIVLAFIERSPMLLKTEAHQWAFEQLMLRDPSRSTLPSHEEVISFLRASGYPLYDLSDEECSGLINLIKAAHPDLDATWENML